MIFMIFLEDAASSVAGSPYAGPGAMILAGIAGLAAAARYYRLARAEDVERERKRRIEAETREEESGASMSSKMDEMKKQIGALEQQIKELRTQNERRILDLIGQNFGLRELLREHGITIPEELSPT